MEQTHRRNLRFQYARNLTLAERFEESARVYEEIGLWKEAGEARRMSRSTKANVVVRETVRLPCKYCKFLVDSTMSICPSCGAPLL